MPHSSKIKITVDTNAYFMGRSKLFYVFILLLVQQAMRSQFFHSIQNYSISEYNAGNQNWDIARSPDGKIFVANNEGLLEFDGLDWTLWKMPNKTTIRSVMYYEDKIFVGSYEEFGYWKRNGNGVLVYNSLLDSMVGDTMKPDEEIWQIMQLNDKIVFRSFARIHIYDQEKISTFYLPSTVMSCHVIDQTLYASTLNDGIFVLRENEFESFFNADVLENIRIISLSKMEPDQYLIATDLKGCFLFRAGKIIPWDSEISALIKKYQLNRFCELGNGNIIFGTIKNGVYLTDKQGKVLFNMNKENGLINNTVLGQFVLSDKELWLGLDNGISWIDLKTSNYFYYDISGTLGAVYDVISFKNRTYIGSNTGLYSLNTSNTLQFIEGSQGQVWDLQEIDSELFCGHNNGTYLVENNSLKLISGYTGGWVIKKVPEEDQIYIQGTYTGLVRYKKNKDKWEVKHLGNNIVPIRYLVFEDKYTAWAAHVHKGIYRIKFDKDYEQIVEFKNYDRKGLWSNYQVRINNLRNTIVFHSINGWQKYEGILDSIVPYDLLNNKLGRDSYIINEENVPFIALRKEGDIIINTDPNGKENIYIPNKYYLKKLISGSENISKINDFTYALNLYDGFMLLNPEKYLTDEQIYQPVIERISVNNNYVPVKTGVIELPFRNNYLLIKMASPLSRNHHFEYILKSSQAASSWTRINGGSLELYNLSEGVYDLSIRAASHTPTKSPETTLQFVVLPPFYKSVPAYFLYLLLLILLLIGLYLLHKRKIQRQQQALQLKFEEDQVQLLSEKEIENEKEIIKLKNESLKNEIKLKSKELANTAISLVKKNEILLILKKELLLHKSGFDNQYSFNKLIKQIDNSIGNEDEWQIFEHNFNQVHDEFFDKLKARFSELTYYDLKICAYIKMNLTTKEIAPLLNISTRGVETHRYRLKKKMNLEKDKNLTIYLQNFH